MAKLVIIVGPREGRTHTLGERCVIGRQSDCSLEITDDTVSRRHAVITRESDGFYVEDLGSSNGTFVNGTEVRRVRLQHGDTIKLSRAVLSFRDERQQTQTAVSVVREQTRNSAVINPHEAVATLMRDSAALDSVDQLEDVHQKLLTMTRFSEAIRSTLDLNSLLDRVLELLFEVFPQGQRSFVMLYDEGGVLRPAASRSTLSEGELKISSSVLDAVVKDRKAILSNNAIEDSRFGSGMSIVEGGTNSLMAAPLLFRNEVLGVIHIDTTLANAPFSEDDLSLFGGLAAAVVSVSVANARLHENLLRRQRLEQELTIAQTVQKSFLPKRVPESDAVELAYHYALAYQVGGDFYDIMELAGGPLAITIGDVSGKGIPAALLMAKTISEMRVAANSRTSPAEMFKMVNEMMLGTVSTEMFVTAASCFFNPADGTTVLSDAGHNPPILKPLSGRAEYVELSKGFPLGVVEDGQYSNVELSLGRGDVLLFYTDGVTDAADSEGASFGTDRLINAVDSAQPGAANAIESVLTAVGNFVGLTRPFDDLTMLALSPK